MHTEKVFVSNYLSSERYENGFIFGLGFVVLCLLLSLQYWSGNSLSLYLPANQEFVFRDKEYWRLFSAPLIHADIEHLLSNSIMLFFLTYFISSFFGAWIAIGLSFFMGAIIEAVALLSLEKNTFLVGASGIIFFQWGFWIVQYLLIQNQLSIAKRLIRVFGVFLILLVPTSYAPSTSYFSHYFGFSLGAVIGVFCFPIWSKKVKEKVNYKYVIIQDFENEEKELN